MIYGIDKDKNYELYLLKNNLIGAKNLKNLYEMEKNITSQRALELSFKPIAGDFDYQHLKLIHKYIFGDIYNFAGKDRFDLSLLGSMIKGESQFCFGQYLPNEAKRIFRKLENNFYLKNLNQSSFIPLLAELFGDLNTLHPFREGNGRVLRIFLNQLAKNAGHIIDLNLIPKDDLIQACINSTAYGDDSQLEILLLNVYKG